MASEGEVHEEQCAYCKKTLQQGADIVLIQRGIVGTKRAIPLEVPDVYCGHDCVRKDYEPENEGPERTP